MVERVLSFINQNHIRYSNRITTWRDYPLRTNPGDAIRNEETEKNLNVLLDWKLIELYTPKYKITTNDKPRKIISINTRGNDCACTTDLSPLFREWGLPGTQGINEFQIVHFTIRVTSEVLCNWLIIREPIERFSRFTGVLHWAHI